MFDLASFGRPTAKTAQLRLPRRQYLAGTSSTRSEQRSTSVSSSMRLLVPLIAAVFEMIPPFTATIDHCVAGVGWVKVGSMLMPMGGTDPSGGSFSSLNTTCQKTPAKNASQLVCKWPNYCKRAVADAVAATNKTHLIELFDALEAANHTCQTSLSEAVAATNKTHLIELSDALAAANHTCQTKLFKDIAAEVNTCNKTVADAVAAAVAAANKTHLILSDLHQQHCIAFGMAFSVGMVVLVVLLLVVHRVWSYIKDQRTENSRLEQEHYAELALLRGQVAALQTDNAAHQEALVGLVGQIEA